MLLIPFVENAFKHGVGMIEHPQIDIDLLEHENILIFSVRNRYNPASTETKDKTAGIGLANVKRRLELVYPGRHELQVHNSDTVFTIDLQLKIDNNKQ